MPNRVRRAEIPSVHSVVPVLQSQAQSQWAGPNYNLQAVQLFSTPTQVFGFDTSSCSIAAELDHTTGDVTFDLTLN